VSERNAVQRAFDEFGRQAGFEKKSGSWYRQSDEVIAAINLQKSQYGPLYYINVGFWLRQLDDERYPKMNQWHVLIRLEDLLPDAEKRIGELLNLDSPVSDEQRITELVALLDEQLLPVIERGSSMVGLRAMVDDGTFAGAGIRGPAHEALAGIK
jgi:hypothetical protein